jgi:hypothetical protein
LCAPLLFPAVIAFISSCDCERDGTGGSVGRGDELVIHWTWSFKLFLLIYNPQKHISTVLSQCDNVDYCVGETKADDVKKRTTWKDILASRVHQHANCKQTKPRWSPSRWAWGNLGIQWCTTLSPKIKLTTVGSYWSLPSNTNCAKNVVVGTTRDHNFAKIRSFWSWSETSLRSSKYYLSNSICTQFYPIILEFWSFQQDREKLLKTKFKTQICYMSVTHTPARHLHAWNAPPPPHAHRRPLVQPPRHNKFYKPRYWKNNHVYRV